MQNLQAIDEAIGSLQRRINAALTLVEHSQSSTSFDKYTVLMKLRQAHQALLKARGRMQAILRDAAVPPSTTSTAPPSATKISLGTGRNSRLSPRDTLCRRCGEILRREQLGNHMWHVHQIDIDGRTKDLARVAAELQQRDHDLYRDD